jgi:hypothetical protein
MFSRREDASSVEDAVSSLTSSSSDAVNENTHLLKTERGLFKSLRGSAVTPRGARASEAAVDGLGISKDGTGQEAAAAAEDEQTSRTLGTFQGKMLLPRRSLNVETSLILSSIKFEMKNVKM